VTMSVTELRSDLASALDSVHKGEPVKIVRGKKKTPLVVMIPYEKFADFQPRKKRVLGRLSHYKPNFDSDWKIGHEDMFPSEFSDKLERSYAGSEQN